MNESPSKPKRFWQKNPLRFGFLILLSLFAVFLLILLFSRSSSQKEESRSSRFAFGSKVAILKVEGVIYQSEPVLKELRKFRKDRTIKAVVLRVDSPGGAVAPSQEIYQELKRFKKEKPVVASMASVAASGGYYICLPCNYIYASPGTITGSIGVIMQATDISELLQWMKIKEEVIKSGKYKDAGSVFRSLTEEERNYFQSLLDNVHQQFQSSLMESRKFSQQQAEQVSDGRIFTGEQAKQLGLIDELGNLEDAIKKAAQLGGIIGEPEVIWPRRRYGFFEDWGAKIAEKFLNQLLGPLFNPLWYLESGTIIKPQRSKE